MGRPKKKSKLNNIHKLAAPKEKAPPRIKHKLDVLGKLALRPEKVVDFFYESEQINDLFTRPPCADSPGKTKPKLDVLGKLALRPEKVVDFYYESKLSNELFTRPPCADSPIELLALQNDREHVEMLQNQQDLLEHEQRQDAVNRSRIEELYETQIQLRERFIELNHFFKDCDERRTFAENKVAEEKQVHVKLKNAISDYKNKFEILSGFRETLKKTVKDFETYETVLNDVVASTDNNWFTIKEIMDGCEALMLARVEIDEMQGQKLQRIEEVRVQIVKITNEAMLEVLGLKNELSQLDRAYAKTVAECLQLEKMIGNIKDIFVDHRLTSWRILNEISIMYKVLCKRKGHTYKYKKTDIERQLDFIKSEIGIIRGVIQECLPDPPANEEKKNLVELKRYKLKNEKKQKKKTIYTSTLKCTSILVERANCELRYCEVATKCSLGRTFFLS